ncbi:DUF2322 family protein [Methylobacillus gramineus]|uniref:DUF2322 family protein n=1 Tax=Methylobacillus gramineus TaxID=755169 RepID=UPI001CFF65CD|nr:DUF2322 family protein [Methylobacillus gramineus]MCB5185289.1 DUF2322 family protein [Methylobacillus gramineus]
MTTFSENLAALEVADNIQTIELLDANANLVGLIENKQGSQGSVRVYYHLFKKYGSINVEAAQDGLSIYAEHTTDAEENPGKHPNIDRLFSIIKHNSPLTLRIN